MGALALVDNHLEQVTPHNDNVVKLPGRINSSDIMHYKNCGAMIGVVEDIGSKRKTIELNRPNQFLEYREGHFNLFSDKEIHIFNNGGHLNIKYNSHYIKIAMISANSEISLAYISLHAGFKIHYEDCAWIVSFNSPEYINVDNSVNGEFNTSHPVQNLILFPNPRRQKKGRGKGDIQNYRCKNA